MKNKFSYSKSEYTLTEKNGQYILTKKQKNNFDVVKWAEQILSTQLRKHPNTRFFVEENVTICININTAKSSHAVCKPSDPYNEKVGKAIALCRLYNIKIPDEIYSTNSYAKEMAARNNLQNTLREICETLPCTTCPLQILREESGASSCSSVLRIGDITTSEIPIRKLIRICQRIMNNTKIPQATKRLIKDTGILDLASED